MTCPLRALRRVARRLAAARADAVRRTVRRAAASQPSRQLALLAHVLQCGNRQSRFLFDDAAGLHRAAHVRRLTALLGVAFDDVDALDGRARAVYGLHRAALAAFFAAPDHHRIALNNRCFHTIYNTSGASDAILRKPRSRSSRMTGPKTRVPRGSRLSFSPLIITHALSSHRTTEPSPRRTGALVRTTTAFTTWPFLTAAPGMALFTVPTTTSPTCA